MTGRPKAFDTTNMETLYNHYTAMPRVAVINSLSATGEKAIEPDIKKGLPILYTNLNAFANSTLVINCIIKALGTDTKVRVRHGNFANPYEYAYGRRHKKIPLGRFITNHFLQTTGELHYMGNYALSKQQLQLTGFKMPDVSFKDSLGHGSLWVGAKGCVTPLHSDGPDIFIHQLAGTKRWTIFPPSDFFHLYTSRPHVKTHPNYFTSAIDLLHVDVEKFTEYAHATPLQVTLEAGMGLYLPAGWFHFVETLEDSVMINFWNPDDNAVAAIFA